MTGLVCLKIEKGIDQELVNLIPNWYNLIPNFLIISQGKVADFVAMISPFGDEGGKLLTIKVQLQINSVL